MQLGDYETFVDFMNHDIASPTTGDGVRWDDPKVNIIQINSDVFDV